MSLIERYEREMRRSRWVSTTGAVVMLMAVARELYGTLHAFSIVENLETRVVVEALLLPLLVGIAFVARIAALRSAERPYHQLAASWLVCAGVAAWYIWWTTLPPCVSNDNRVCFRIYDSGRADGVRLFAACFLVLSVVRSTITALYAAFKRDYK